MSQESIGHIQELIKELSVALSAGNESNAIARRVRQALALLHAADDVLVEIRALERA